MTDDLVKKIAKQIWHRLRYRELAQSVFLDKQELKFKVACVDGRRYRKYVDGDHYEFVGTYDNPPLELIEEDVCETLNDKLITHYQKIRKTVWVGK